MDALVEVFEGRPEALGKALTWLAKQHLRLAEVAEEGMEEYFGQFINALGLPNEANQRLIVARIRHKFRHAPSAVNEVPPAAPLPCALPSASA